MKRYISLVLGLMVGIGISFSAQAETISNIQVVPNGTTMFIQWTGLSDQVLSNMDGYAIWWSQYKSDMANNKSDKVQQFIGDQVNSIEIRAAAFEANVDHHFRVCSYYKEGRRRYLANCSKIRKWKKGTGTNITTDELIDADDIDVAETSISSTTDPQEVFGVFGAKSYDTYVVLNWSRPNLATSEYDRSIIEISKSSSFSSDVEELRLEKGTVKARINGLDPSTTYYIRGSFQKGIRNFGTGVVKTIKTQSLMTATQKARLDRLRKRGLIKDLVSEKATLNIGGTTTQTTTTTTVSEDTNPQTISTIEARIKKLESELSTLKARLRRLKGTSSTVSSRRRSSSSRSGLSIRERLRLRLQR